MGKDDTSKLEKRIKELEQQNEQLKNSLRESEKREGITLNSIGDAVISTDKEGNVVQMNSVAQKLTGWHLENARGKAFEEVFSIFKALTGEKAINPINKVLEKGTIEGLANHTKLISKDGDEYQIADSAAPIKDDQGNIYGVIAVFRDVTEEYKKNQQIKENKDFLETTFQSIQDGISVLNTDLSISYVNHVMESWYAENMPLVGKKCYKAYHDSAVPCDPCPAVRCMKTKKTESEIVPGSPDPNSPVNWVELYSYPIIDSETGEVKGVVEFVRDITQKEEAERELKRHKDLLAKSQEIAHIGSWELDLTENRLVWSDEVYRIFGLEPQEFEATYEAFLSMVHPDDREAVSNAYESSIIDGRDHYEIEHRIVRKKNGEIRYVHERCDHTKDESGKVIKSTGMVQDITEQRQTEENFRKLFENAPIGVFRTNSKGKPLMANKTMAHTLGFETPEEVIEYYDDLAEQLYVDPQRRQEFLQIMKDQGWVENFEYKAKRKDGKHIWLSMTAKVSKENDDSDFIIDGFTSDVTERKKAERELEKRENFISALLNNLNVGVVACDAEGILTYFNKKTREFHGLPQQNLHPEAWADYYDLYTKDGKTKLNTEDIPLYKALRGVYFNDVEMVIKPREGSSLSILNSGQPLKDAQGNITGAVVAMHDITERKQAEYKLQKKYEELETTEEELRASNEELHEANEKLEAQKEDLEVYKMMVESSEDMMAVVDTDYNYICVNNAYLKYYQLKHEEVIGYKAREIIGEKNFEETVKPNLDKCLKGEAVQYEMIREFPELGKVNLDIIYYPLETDKGTEGVVSAIRDITERKEYEKELFNAKKRAEESEELTRQNLHNIEFLADCAINFVDRRYEKDIYSFIAEKLRKLNPEASFVVVNEVDNDNSVVETKAFKDSNGSIGQFINNIGIQILGQQYPLDERIEGLLDGKIKTIDGGIHELTFELIPKDISAKIEDELEIESIYGIGFILNNKIYADAFLVFPKGKGIQNIETLEAFVRQASLALKRRESEQELIRAKEKAEESDRLKSAFLANMSHEIRTPMNGIIGFSQILKESDYPKDQQKKFIDIIHSRTQHLLHIINDLVDVSKIEANQLTLNVQHFYLNDVMQELYTVFSNELKSREKGHIQLKLHLGLNYEESYIQSDFNRFRQVMDNLLKNAVKFTEEGTIEFGYKSQYEGSLLFYVKDSGVGIPNEQQKHIFERFRQVDDSTTRNYEGTGLGLTISKNLVELLGGEMWLKSKEGEGSVFYFTLPYEGKSSKQSGKEKKAEEGISNKEGKTLLLIEDDSTSREYMKALLEPKGMNLISCETGEEGYEAFINHPEIDLILMDIKLPDTSGLEVTRKIRASSKNREVPIIAQTAYAMSGDDKKSIEVGCDDYISKPIDKDELLEKIGKFI